MGCVVLTTSKKDEMVLFICKRVKSCVWKMYVSVYVWIMRFILIFFLIIVKFLADISYIILRINENIFPLCHADDRILQIRKTFFCKYSKFLIWNWLFHSNTNIYQIELWTYKQATYSAEKDEAWTECKSLIFCSTTSSSNMHKA